jgi:hypothetical protein
MTDLTKKEVLDQLKKLGVHNTSELKFYYKEYKDYSVKYSQVYFSRILQRIGRQLLQRKHIITSHLLKRHSSRNIKS